MKAPALSIARPLSAELAAHPFSGRVLGRFERACNLVDIAERVITLTLPEIGNGPFSIVMAGWPHWFESLPLDQVVIATADRLNIGPWQIDLTTAKIWEAQLPCSTQPLKLNSAIAGLLSPYSDWPHPAGNSILNNRLVEVATHLNRAMREAEGAEKDEKIAQAVGQLAGLGSGLTPAGDDYLVGVMAALWLTGQKALLPRLAKVAADKTTALSAAFLNAAGRGEFIEPWHALVLALFRGEAESFSQALERVARFGASSGRDALAGFATTLRRRLEIRD